MKNLIPMRCIPSRVLYGVMYVETSSGVFLLRVSGAKVKFINCSHPFNSLNYKVIG